MVSIEIYGDNHVEADWFRGLSPDLSSAAVHILGPRGSNPRAIDDLLSYDRPDIILVANAQPRFVLEKTREVPTGHNVGQRVARLVRAVELQIPTVKFFPFDAMKHGAYAGLCNLNIRLLRAFERMAEIHDVPALAINWPADRRWELITTGEENREIATIVQSFLDAGMPRWWGEARATMIHMRQEYLRRLSLRPSYGQNPPSVQHLPTSTFLEIARLETGDGSTLRALGNRAQTLVYTMDMSPEKCRREDPYTGTQFIYDYADCRTGAAVAEKRQNLVLRFPRVPLTRWSQANPDDPGRKSSNWYLTANAMVFSDGVKLLRVSE